MTVDIKVLGIVQVFENGIPIGARSKALALVATLAAAPGFTASHEEIATRLWPGAGGGSKATAIRQLCTALRREIPGCMEKSNDRGRCRLVVDSDSVDLVRFRKVVEQARTSGGNERLRLLESAIGMWHGEPLSGLSDVDFRADRGRLLTELRGVIVDFLREAEALGRFGEMTWTLDEALARWPGDEEFGTVLLRSAARSGGAKALKRARDEWISAYGGMSDAMARDVESSREPVPPAPRPRLTGGSRLVPRQIPLHREVLFGRADEFAAMSETLLRADAGRRSRAIGLRGMGGAGKTLLAQCWADDHQDEFPDGVLYADLDGSSPFAVVDAEQILATFAVELEIPDLDRVPADRLAAEFRTKTASLRALFVLDNARDAEHVRPLLPGGGSCAVIVTSRDRLDGLALHEGARLLDVDVLDEDAAVELLADEMGPDHARNGRHLLPEIAQRCGHLPLALTLVGARTANRPLGAVRELVDLLRDPGTQLEPFEGSHQDDSFRASIALSVDQLSEAAVDMLWKAALHPGPTISAAALSWLAADGVTDVLRVRAELVDAHLLRELTFSRFAMHDLVRAYSLEIAARQDAAVRELATSCIFDFLLHNAAACDRFLVPLRNLPLGASDGIDVVEPESASAAMAWLSAEYDTLTSAIRRAEEENLHRYLWLLPMTLVTYQWRKSRFADAIRFLDAALKGAEQEADPGGRAMVYRMIAGTRLRTHEPVLARARMIQATAEVDKNHGAWGAAENAHGLGLAHHACGEWEEAASLITKAAGLFRDRGFNVGEANALMSLAEVHCDIGNVVTARVLCDSARDVARRTSDGNGLAGIMRLSGRLRRLSGDLIGALAEFEDAIAIYREYGYEANEVRTLLSLAEVARESGRHDMAAEALDRAETVAAMVDDDGGLLNAVAVARVDRVS